MIYFFDELIFFYVNSFDVKGSTIGTKYLINLLLNIFVVLKIRHIGFPILWILERSYELPGDDPPAYYR